MQKLLTKLQDHFPALHFTAGSDFSWSPATGEIIYDASSTGSYASWSLLHETGHALLDHQTYGADFELLRLEIAAWQKARALAKKFNIEIDEDHIEDCLDTYRDWLYKRSICPTCHAKSLQQDDLVHYRCFNCHTIWRVSSNRFARTYRTTKNIPQPAAVFHQSIG